MMSRSRVTTAVISKMSTTTAKTITAITTIAKPPLQQDNNQKVKNFCVPSFKHQATEVFLSHFFLRSTISLGASGGTSKDVANYNLVCLEEVRGLRG